MTTKKPEPKPPRTVDFLVPLSWAGDPWTSPALSWMTADDAETRDPEAAVRFRFRVDVTGRDGIAVELRLDDVNGGIDQTVDLDWAIDQLFTSVRAKLELKIWPDGRPDPADDDERRAQDTLMDLAFTASDDIRRDRLKLDRMHAIRDRQRVVAEWPVLIVDAPAGWESLDNRPTPHLEQVARAYLHARQELAADPGK